MIPMDYSTRAVVLDGRKPLATFELIYERDRETMDYLPAIIHLVTVDRQNQIVDVEMDPQALRISLASQDHDLTQITPDDLRRFREEQLRLARSRGGRIPSLTWDYRTQRWSYRSHRFPHERLVNLIHNHPRVHVDEILRLDISNLTTQPHR